MIAAKNAQWKHQKPPSVFTFGFGANHNEDMLSSIGSFIEFLWSSTHSHIMNYELNNIFSGIWFGNVLPCGKR